MHSTNCYRVIGDGEIDLFMAAKEKGIDMIKAGHSILINMRMITIVMLGSCSET